ncbi:hypothetical protein BDB01DRAFT_794402 [Pilobolus umbonatus]|nr:hypothetical protein BDB01DRAFT_794402 [Pilobolus umbonatus]
MEQNTCTPTHCASKCVPECNKEQKCIMQTMTDCAECPTPRCINPSVLAKPSQIDQESSNNGRAALIGGIVGGFIGLGFLIGVAILFYVRWTKRRDKFAFMNSNVSIPQYNRVNYDIGNAMSVQSLGNRGMSTAIHTKRRSLIGHQRTVIVDTNESNEKEVKVDSNRVSSTHSKRASNRIQANRLSVPDTQYSNRSSNLSAVSSDDGQSEGRQSCASSVYSTAYSPKPNKQSIQAIQVVRAKPQLVRMDSVRSTKATHDESPKRYTVNYAEEDKDILVSEFPSIPSVNPFKDSQSEISAKSNEGEITVIWKQ